MLPTSHRVRCRATPHCTCVCKNAMLRCSPPHPTAAQRIKWCGVPNIRKVSCCKLFGNLLIASNHNGKPCQPTCVPWIHGHRTSLWDLTKLYNQCSLKSVLDRREGRARIIDSEIVFPKYSSICVKTSAWLGRCRFANDLFWHACVVRLPAGQWTMFHKTMFRIFELYSWASLWACKFTRHELDKFACA